MKKLFLLLLVCGTVWSALAQQKQPQANNWSWGGPLHPNQAAFDVKHYTLRLKVNPEQKSLSGSNEITLEVKQPLDQILLDLIQAYQVTGVRVDGQETTFTRSGDQLTVQLPTSKAANQRLKLTVSYAGSTPEAVRPPWQGGFTWSKDSNGNHWMGLSSQNEGGKIFMPCKDHPSDKAEEGVSLFITVPAPYQVAANGVLQTISNKSDQLTYHWVTDYPITNYGINFTMGKFHKEERQYNTINRHKTPMVIYVLEENAAKAKSLMDILEVSVRTREKYFGEFPFWKEKIGVVETPYLGMEHQTINAYGNHFKYTKVGDLDFDWLLYHELGHEWWGNKVNVKDWADFWIHEGLCTYGDWLFTREHAGEEAYRAQVLGAATGIQNKQPIVPGENLGSDEVYQGDIYSKGAYLLHTLRYVMGDSLFFPALKGFATEPAFTYQHQVTTQDFVTYFSQALGQDLKPLLDFYLRTTNLPEVEVQPQADNQYAIRLTNTSFALPMDVKTDQGTQRVQLSSQPVVVTSAQAPVIDPDGWYLKRVSSKQ